MYNLMSGRNKKADTLAQRRTMNNDDGKNRRVRTNKHKSLVAIISFVEPRQGPWAFFG